MDTDEKKEKDKIVFRNYVPMNEVLRGDSSDKTPQNKSTKIEDKGGETLADKVLLDRIVHKANKIIDEAKVVPRKPNWDLKQGLEESMKELNEQTEKCIRILRQKYEENEDLSFSEAASDDEND